MKNKFKYQYNTIHKILLAVFLIGWLAIFAINVMKVANLFVFYSRDTIAEVTCIVFALFAIVIWFWLFNLKYVVTDKIALKFGPFDLTKGKIKTDKMMKIVQATNTDKLFANFVSDDNPQIALININPCDFENFANCVRSKNPKVLFDKAEIEQNPTEE
ncbi:MAG: hypothetical protein IJV77_02615 [Clostridia bacterium]|nr:hypothetical protein [Clostridia bacterium]